jgi:hypothetical protein
MNSGIRADATTAAPGFAALAIAPGLQGATRCARLRRACDRP